MQCLPHRVFHDNRLEKNCLLLVRLSLMMHIAQHSCGAELLAFLPGWDHRVIRVQLQVHRRHIPHGTVRSYGTVPAAYCACHEEKDNDGSNLNSSANTSANSFRRSYSLYHCDLYDRNTRSAVVNLISASTSTATATSTATLRAATRPQPPSTPRRYQYATHHS